MPIHSLLSMATVIRNGKVYSLPKRVCGLRNLSCLPSDPVVGRKMPPSKDGQLTNAMYVIGGKLGEAYREGQEGLACCSSWDRKELHMTGRPTNNKDVCVSVSKEVMKLRLLRWESVLNSQVGPVQWI